MVRRRRSPMWITRMSPCKLKSLVRKTKRRRRNILRNKTFTREGKVL
uniref:Uncharacterized protein n=1 Tax=Arundo donax TaxID=35708 RepID=A0A0A9EYU1_ARUDO